MAAVTKTENGMAFPAEAYAYVPDASAPSTWKLRLWESPAKKVTARQVGMALAALGKGFRGKKVQIPAADLPGVTAKVHAAWLSAHPAAKAKSDPPAKPKGSATPAAMDQQQPQQAAMKEAATTELTQVQAIVYDAIEDALRSANGGNWVPFGIEALFPDRVIVAQDGRYYSYPYTIGEDNQVALGKPEEVLESFEPVGASAQPPEPPEPGHAPAGMAEAAFFEAKDDEGKTWEAVLIRSGASLNGTFYPDAVLREAAPLFEGARVFAKADEEHLRGTGKSVNQLAGWISSPRFVAGKAPDTGYIRGQVNLVEGVKTLRESIVDAWKRGKRDLVGLSIDAAGRVKASVRGAAKRVAQAITKVNSVDLIVEPSAGGALVRLVEAAEEPDPMKERMLATIKAKRPDLFAKIDAASVSDEELEARYAEALAPSAETKGAPSLTQADLRQAEERMNEAVRMAEARAHARSAIDGSRLPDAAKERLQARFDGLSSFKREDVDNEVKAERAYVARMAEALGDAGKVRLAVGDIEVGDRSKSIAEMLDAFFDPKHKNHRAVHSFRECYIEITGDRRVTGRLEDADRSRLTESVGAAFRESLDTTAFSNVLGNTLNRRLVAEYAFATDFDGYKYVTGEPVPLNDFRQQTRVRYGGYGDLPTVAESNPYVALASPADEAATYTPAKRGGTEDVTLEMIKNDDVGAIRRIPVKIARAAKRTLSKFVFDFIRTNPVIYDGLNLFHANHGNLGAAALDATSLAARRLAMLEQTEAGSADRLGIGPATILVPLDLQEAAWNLQQRGTNLDKTFIQSMLLNIVPVWYWTDTNDWALAANPADIPMIEIGFLDGQQEPELFVQDLPNVGSMFSNDKLTYKTRHIYGGAVIDFRGLDKSVV